MQAYMYIYNSHAGAQSFHQLSMPIAILGKFYARMYWNGMMPALTIQSFLYIPIYVCIWVGSRLAHVQSQIIIIKSVGVPEGIQVVWERSM